MFGAGLVSEFEECSVTCPSETGLAESGFGGISSVGTVSVEGSDSEDRDDNSLTGTRFS